MYFDGITKCMRQRVPASPAPGAASVVTGAVIAIFCDVPGCIVTGTVIAIFSLPSAVRDRLRPKMYPAILRKPAFEPSPSAPSTQVSATIIGGYWRSSNASLRSMLSNLGSSVAMARGENRSADSMHRVSRAAGTSVSAAGDVRAECMAGGSDRMGMAFIAVRRWDRVLDAPTGWR